jgi:hypothetical protein
VRQVSGGGGGMPSFSGKLSKGQIRDVASFVVDSTKNHSAALTAFEPNHEKVSDCHSDYACYKQAFGNIAYYDGPETALSRLATYMKDESGGQQRLPPDRALDRARRLRALSRQRRAGTRARFDDLLVGLLPRRRRAGFRRRATREGRLARPEAVHG